MHTDASSPQTMPACGLDCVNIRHIYVDMQVRAKKNRYKYYLKSE